VKYTFNRRAVQVFLVLGVFLLIVIVGFWNFRFERRIRAPIALAARTAHGSSEVRHVLGSPTRVGRFAKGNLNSGDGNGNADLAIPVYGPLGRGTLLEWAQEDAGKWSICSLVFRSSDGLTSIPLVEDSSTHCERE
jgi:hypothetical protein